MMAPEEAVIDATLVCAGGALVTLGIGRNRALAGWLAFGCVAVASALVWSAVLQVLWHGPGEPTTFVRFVEYGFSLRLYVDGLSAVFLGLIATVAVPATFYSIDYLQHYPDYSPRLYYPNLLLFIAAMYAIVSTTDTMYFFFIFWQMMTLTSFALVRFESRKPEKVRAANKYLLMMQVACVVTMLGALLLAPAGPVSSPQGVLMRFDFDALSQHLPQLFAEQRGVVALAMLMFLVGFGIKSGMWPLGQIWLPDAHPAAPSPVSALLSGVMIKTGIYGLMRYFLWLVPAEAVREFPAEAWGGLLAVLGTLTLVVGTLQALKQEQAKRLLAFSSIGQVGYILLGFGTCLALLRSPEPSLRLVAAAGFYGALFHTLNHGLFKSLLFLNAGSVLYATHTQNLSQLGGLLRWMPHTGLCALVASLAISGVPLFNGFASKWCLSAATLEGGRAVKYLPLLAVFAILTSTLTLASFIKFFGGAFLSRTSPQVARVSSGQASLEVPATMRWAQYALALCCVLFGLFPLWLLNGMQTLLLGGWQGFSAHLEGMIPFGDPAGLGVTVFGGRGLIVPVVVGLLLAALGLLAYGLSRLGGAPRRADAPWLCGYARARAETRYTAHHYYGEVKRHLRWVGGVPREPAGLPPTEGRAPARAGGPRGAEAPSDPPPTHG